MLDLSSLKANASNNTAVRDNKRPTAKQASKGKSDKTTRKARIKKCKRCGLTPDQTIFEHRAHICNACKLTDSKLLRALLPIVNKYGTTHCFESLDDVISYLQIRAYKYQKFGIEYTRTNEQGNKERVWLYPALDLCHIKPKSMGGLLKSDNLFIWLSSENRGYGDSNKHLFPPAPPLTTRPKEYDLASLDRELSNRFGKDGYHELRHKKGLLPASGQLDWRKVSGCDNHKDAHVSLIEQGFTTDDANLLDDDYLQSTLLLEYARCCPIVHDAIEHYKEHLTREFTLRDLTTVLHYLYGQYNFHLPTND